MLDLQPTLVSLDLECSDGRTVLDPGVDATVRANLTFATTPEAPASTGLALASSIASDVFSSFGAGSEARAYLISTVFACSSLENFVMLGAQTERWSPGQDGTLGSEYAGFVK